MGQMEEKRVPQAAGTVLAGRYRLEQVLGCGGFGVTYAATGLEDGRRVAVKEGRALGKEEQDFQKEADILCKFAGEPGIVRILDSFEDGGSSYIVMEYMEGRTLKEALRERSFFPAEELSAKMLPLIHTLGKIHRAGVIHRDISPDNIMELPDGSLKLFDFGAAKNYGEQEGASSVIVKGGYAPPEQYQANGEQGPWTDVYGLCATMYACLAGREPEDALSRVLDDELQPPSAHNPLLPGAVDEVLMKGLSLEPEERYASMEELEEAVRGWAGAGGSALPGETPGEPGAAGTDAGRGAGKGAGRGVGKDAGRGVGKDAGRGAGKDAGRGVGKDAGKDSGKAHRGKRWRTVGILTVLVLLAGAGALLWRLAPGGAGPGSKGTDTVVLVPDREMTQEELAQAGEALEARLRLAAGEGNYQLTEEDGIWTATTPEKLFEGKDLKSSYNCYIARPGEWFLMTQDDKRRIAGLSWEDIEEVEVLEREGACLLEVTVGDGAEEVLEAFWEEEGQLCLALDVGLGGYYYYMPAFPGETKDSFYAGCEEGEERFAPVIAYNLEHPATAALFQVVCEPSVLWEDEREAAYPGENQCREDSFSGETVILEYDCLEEGDLTESERQRTERVFKSRLDCLDIPYAFGLGEADGKSVYVKTAAEDMNRFLGEILCGNTNLFGLGDSWGSFAGLSGLGEENFEIAGKEDGGFSIKLVLPESQREGAREILNQKMEEGEEELFLTAGVWNIASCALTEECLDGTLSFDTLAFRESQEMGEDYRPLFALVKTVAAGSKLEASYMLRNIVFLDREGLPDETGKLAWPENWMEGLDLSAYVETADSLGLGTEVYYEYNLYEKKVYFLLDMEPSEGFPKRALAAVQEIYEAIDFDSGECDTVAFYLIQEEGDERARVFFYKYGSRAQGMYASYIMEGGRAEAYQEEFTELIETDPFYRRYLEEPEL